MRDRIFHKRKSLRGLILIVSSLAVLVAALLFRDWRTPSPPQQEPTLDFSITQFEAIDGWADGGQGAAVPAFKRSCKAVTDRQDAAPMNRLEALGPGRFDVSLAGVAADWRAACAAALSAPDGIDDSAARALFEAHFTPVTILNVRLKKRWFGGYREVRETKGLLTGYYEPEFDGALAPTETAATPLLARPDDLVMAELGAFRPDLAGTRIAGRVVNGRLQPYETRAQIDAGALDGKATPLAWADPADAFFLHIQGSGRVNLEDGRVLRLGYDGQNGHPYTAIGRLLVEQGIMPLEDVSLQSIRAWLADAPPHEAKALMDANASYVFFRELTEVDDPALGPLGAQGLPLTPKASLAVDRRYYPMGAPVFVASSAPEGQGGADASFRKLMIAQDTGGAIRGPVRGDVFWGWGAKAERIAGEMRAEAEMTLLVPKPVAAALAGRDR
ncbi:MAG: murein transglycosylase A [Pseudomonadota bacterium]